jgi:acetyl-CoA C-acetyltransferase
MSFKNVVIVDARRTAIGTFLGNLSTVPAHKLGAEVIQTLLKDNNVEGKDVSEVILGQVLTAATGQNPARQASKAAGIPNEVPAWLINQVCGSGLRSVALAAQAIATEQSHIVVAGGQESMSLSPHAITMRNGQKMGNATLIDTMIQDGLWDVFNDYHMGVTAENIATKFSISRDEQDAFAANSQQKTEIAQKSGAFKNEIVPVTISHKKGDIVVDTDEFPRHGTTKESLSGLRPAFSKDGTVTAGNASGINDGAAALLLMSEKEAKKRHLTPLAYVRGFGQAGVAPEIMGTGPIQAVKNALSHAQWAINDLDLIESNEAFAAQAISVNRELGWNEKKINIHGGAIALGHPIGASGARILTTLLHAMQSQNAKKGLATLCVGGGMGVALCVERA